MAIKTIEQFRTEATSEVESEKPLYAQVNNEKQEFTEAQYEQHIEDRAQAKLNDQNNGYKSARLDAYGSWNEQLDLLFHDMTSGKGDKTGEWYKAVKKVKDDNPKPS
jgi:hypothetical protein